VISSAPQMPPRSDAELLAAHVAGDRLAFEELFRRHHGRLHRLASVSCRCPEDAADALQDAMLAAHRNAGAFRHHAAVSSWLHRIVVNACRDKLRYNRIHPTVELESAVHPVVDRTAQIDAALLVRCALEQLSVEQRAVLVAVDIQGYPVADAARMLDIPEGTVKSRAARARARLAAVLGPQDGGTARGAESR
jgi:RNA polymerase sigma-70 factor (ECF subfamily)